MSEKTFLIKKPFHHTSLSIFETKFLYTRITHIQHLTFICLCIGLLSFWATPAIAKPFSVQYAKTRLVDKVYRLDASLKYQLPPNALNALENGVTLILALDIEVIRSRRYMWNDDVAELEQLYEIQYLALTDQYLLKNKNSGSQFVYSTLDEALAPLEKIEGLPLIDAHLLDKDEHYMVQVRSRLVFDSLPAPLRLKAYFSDDWWLTSGWHSWDLTGTGQ